MVETMVEVISERRVVTEQVDQMGICCKRGGEHVQGPWVWKNCGTFKTEELDF